MAVFLAFFFFRHAGLDPASTFFSFDLPKKVDP
jgi:hypothetical protein